MKRFSWILLLIALLWGAGERAGAYDYPIKDPYVATIVGTPTWLEADLPEKIDFEVLGLTVFPDRPTPDVFWYQREFLYTLSYQKQTAPLIFIIAGTGSLENTLRETGLPIEFLGSVPYEMMPKVYQQSSVILLPSYMEGFPCICVEAISCGVPLAISLPWCMTTILWEMPMIALITCSIMRIVTPLLLISWTTSIISSVS